MSKKDEALKLALEALEYADNNCFMDTHQQAITTLRERLAQPETVMAEYKFQTYAAYKADGEMKIGVVPEQAIRALTDQCAALVQERDELQKQVWLYEKNGVTCQTYRHKVEQSCSECNVHESYTTPQPEQATTLISWDSRGVRTVNGIPDDAQQPEQKPYAWADAGSNRCSRKFRPDWIGPIPLYTAPQTRREWVGLTKEECLDCMDGTTHYTLCRAIEAKLKEKNT